MTEAPEAAECRQAVEGDRRACARPPGHDGKHEPFPLVEYVTWARPREVREVLQDGRPRPLRTSPSGFDLSWRALDALAASVAKNEPCEVILTGFGRREDGHYFYLEATNPAYLQEVLGWRQSGDGLKPLCPECDQYPRHARGCSLAP